MASKPHDAALALGFLGGASTVTGSRHLLESAAGLRLLVDCGLFQGYKSLRERNWQPFAFDPSRLDAVLLTHAHLDHAGALPMLVRDGFRGPVLCSAATAEVCAVLLPDSGRLQEEDADFHNRHQRGRHRPALPLYTEDDAYAALRHLEPVDVGSWQTLPHEARVRLHGAGHILGASSVEVAVGERSLLFSGDLGRSDDPLMRPPAPPVAADWMVVESTYGDRLHERSDSQALLGEIVRRTAARGGSVLIPAFAVGRAQTVLLALSRLKARGEIPDLPCYLDSPMAIDMTELYARHRSEHRLSDEECRAMCSVATAVRSVAQSQALQGQRFPAVIVSASGMATGGRVLHHLRARAGDARNSIVFVGYQSPGTRGARLVAGERRIRILGEEVAVQAEVLSVAGMSAHADAGQIVDWLRAAPRPPRRLFLAHGEPGPADALRQRIEAELGWPVGVPWLGDRVALDTAQGSPA